MIPLLVTLVASYWTRLSIVALLEMWLLAVVEVSLVIVPLLLTEPTFEIKISDFTCHGVITTLLVNRSNSRV